MTVSPADASVCETMGAIVGAEHVEQPGDVGGRVRVTPADGVEAAAVLRAADERGVGVCVAGSGTKDGWMSRAAAGPVVELGTRRMAGVLEHTWQDMTCTVQAGCTWQRMQTALAVHGQQVALDPLWPERATVGGVCAANDSGALRLKYGGLRDLVIGMTVVLADGTIARSGGKVVKNVAGYDLPKLMCGSFGTLAMITEVTFRLHAIARTTASMTVFCDGAAPLGEVMLGLLDARMSLQAMQMRGAGTGYSLDIRLESLPEVLAQQMGAIGTIAHAMGLRAEEASEAAWNAREQMFLADASVFKATMLPTQVAWAVTQVIAMGGRAVAQAHGLLTGCLPVGQGAGRLASVRRELEAGGGSLTMLRMMPGEEFDRWGALPGTLPLMRAVKRQFDPRGVLNGGRYLGGI